MSENVNGGADSTSEGGGYGSSGNHTAFSMDWNSLEDASEVLLLGPMRESLDNRACSTMMEAWPVADRDVLFVSLTQPADERFGLLRQSITASPERVCIVSGADRHSSETRIEAGEGQTTLSVSAIRDPSDLPRLGITINKAIDRWEEAGDILMCFHSLTALLQYAEPNRVFRFVHLLQNRLNATAHYHMDVDAHDQQTIATLRPLFDAVVEYDLEGNVTVSD